LDIQKQAAPGGHIAVLQSVITVSLAAKKSISQCPELSPERLVLTYKAANPINHRIEDKEIYGRIRQRYGLSPDFVFAIGSTDPRKNI
jgi:hypothetical protein